MVCVSRGRDFNRKGRRGGREGSGERREGGFKEGAAEETERCLGGLVGFSIERDGRGEARSGRHG